MAVTKTEQRLQHFKACGRSNILCFERGKHVSSAVALAVKTILKSDQFIHVTPMKVKRLSWEIVHCPVEQRVCDWRELDPDVS